MRQAADATVVEVIALNAEDARRACDGGADRIEVCGSMADDGTTPSSGVLGAILALDLPIRTMAMVRPRGGGFVYTPAEIAQMTRSIRSFRALGVDGVVFGCLTPSGDIDVPGLRELMAECASLSVTFHRALDSVSRLAGALKILRECGVSRVLTLGYPCGSARQVTDADAVLGTSRIAQGSPAVMTGGWIEPETTRRLVEGGIREFHFGRAVRGEDGYASPVDPARVAEWRGILSG